VDGLTKNTKEDGSKALSSRSQESDMEIMAKKTISELKE
jgi:hypothetical protein